VREQRQEWTNRGIPGVRTDTALLLEDYSTLFSAVQDLLVKVGSAIHQLGPSER